MILAFYRYASNLYWYSNNMNSKISYKGYKFNEKGFVGTIEINVYDFTTLEWLG